MTYVALQPVGTDEEFECDSATVTMVTFDGALRGIYGLTSEDVNEVVELSVEKIQSTDREHFRKLAKRWKEETLKMSSVSTMVSNPNYLEIIGMGEEAIPLLLEELEANVDHWFTALTAITGENPIPPESRGRLNEMAECWLRWGREKGFR